GPYLANLQWSIVHPVQYRNLVRRVAVPPPPTYPRAFAQKVGAVGNGTYVSLSYPRKRVSRWGGGFPARWIPAFAGMTSGGRLELLCKAPGRRGSKRVPSPFGPFGRGSG